MGKPRALAIYQTRNSLAEWVNQTRQYFLNRPRTVGPHSWADLTRSSWRLADPVSQYWPKVSILSQNSDNQSRVKLNSKKVH